MIAKDLSLLETTKSPQEYDRTGLASARVRKVLMEASMEAQCTQVENVGISGLRTEVAAGELERQFHELPLHKNGMLSREIYCG